MWILFWRWRWPSSKNRGSVVTGVLIGLFVSFVLRRVSYWSSPSPKWVADPKTAASQQQHASAKLESTFDFRHDDTLLEVVQTADNSASKRKELLLVGVMTADKYMKTRARSTFRTWGQDVPGQILYFTGSNSSWAAKEDNIPVVMLPGVDDSYPPQKKSFMMMKYMFEHFGDKFEWFLRADDDVYIRMDLLAKLLRSIDSTRMYFIGQAGLGKDFERGKLHLGPHENFCMGGPGIIFSRPTLEKLVPHIKSCLERVHSNHEDVELGRCVSRTAGLSCTWSYEMRNLFHHSTSGVWQLFKTHKYRNAITMHPLKKHASQYQLHSHILGLKVRELTYESVKVDKDLFLIGSYSDTVNITGVTPSLTKFSPLASSRILSWDFLAGVNILYTHQSVNPKMKLGPEARESLRNSVRELMDIINNISKVRDRAAEMKNLFYGYHRVNPLYGEDFILDLLMTYRNFNPASKKMSKPVRRHAYIQKPFGPLQFRIDKCAQQQDVSQKVQNPVARSINIVVPLSGRLSTFERFLHHFKESCYKLAAKISLNLFIVYFSKSEPDRRSIFNYIEAFNYNNNFSSTSSSAQRVKLITAEQEFSRGFAVDHGISKCANDGLIFVLDVDFAFSPQVIQRVVQNTVKGEKVYFPIVFSLYDPQFRRNEEFSTLISNENGYWRESGYGIAAFYKSDYKNVGGYDLSIKGWGKEDVMLYDRFVRSNLTIFRAPDPELIHIYHEINCDNKLSRVQHEMCIGSQSSTLGSASSLMKYTFENRKKNKIIGVVASFVFNNPTVSTVDSR